MLISSLVVGADLPIASSEPEDENECNCLPVKLYCAEQIVIAVNSDHNTAARIGSCPDLQMTLIKMFTRRSDSVASGVS